METTILTTSKESQVKSHVNSIKNNRNAAINSMSPKFHFKNKKGEIINYN
jgi:hypothetical protein